MSNLPNAEVSPRIVNGVIKFYLGDTFSIDIELNLTDQDGEAIVIGPDDTVKFTFLDDALYIVKEFTFTGIENNTVTLVFDTDCTALFHRGDYTYDVTYTGENRTTVANDNKVVVE